MPNSEESCKRSHKATMQHPPAKTWTGHPYPAYKDSGVEWLGEVPQSWGIFRLKGVVANVTDLTKELDGDNIYLALEHVESWTGKFSIMNNNIDFDSQAKRFQSGDVLFGKLRPYLAKVVYPGRDGVCAGEFLVLRPRHAGLLSKYLEQLLRSKPVIFAVDASTFGAKMPRADWQFIGNMRIPLPPLSEQRAIAHFLDDANERIQRYIHAKEKLIKLLEEQKRVIIHQAVTGQIDVRTGKAYPTYKDSGVDWLGKVPAHWEVRRLKTLCDMRSGDAIVAMSINEAGKYPVFGGNGIRGYTAQYTHNGNYVLIGRQGALCGNIHIARGRFWASEHAVVATLHYRQHVLEWFGAMLETMNLNQYSIAAAQPGLSVDRVLNLWAPVPPTQEQHAIARFLTDTCQRISAACAAVKREIELFHEYRTRLIADVVTGKLDVREAAAALPEKEPPTGGDNCQDGMAFAVQVQSRCP